MKKRLVALLLAMLVAVSCLTIGVAAANQKAMWIFKDKLYITCNAARHIKSTKYPDRRPFDAVSGTSDYTVYAPFDCRIAKIDAKEEHSVFFESVSEVDLADGSSGYITMLLAHDNDISDLEASFQTNPNKVFQQGEVIYQMGDYGEKSSGDHVHVEVARGQYSAVKSQWASVWAFVRDKSNVMDPDDVFYLPSGMSIANAGGYSWTHLGSDPTPAKPAAPAASVVRIDYYSETISFDSQYEVSAYSGFRSTMASGSKIEPNSLLYVRVKAAGGAPASDATVCSIEGRPFAFNKITFDAASGTFNSTSSYQYSFDQSTWYNCTGSLAYAVAAGHAHIYFRLAPTATSFAGEPYEVAFSAPEKPQAPNADVVTFDYLRETLTYGSAYEVSASNFGEVIASGDSITALVDGGITTVYVRVKAQGGVQASDATAITLPGRSAAPAELTAAAETVDQRDDGTIHGVDAAMEYRVSGGSWVACPEDGVIADLPDGVYEVRYKATGKGLASRSTVLTVEQGVPQTFTLHLTVPAFDAIAYNDAQPEAKALAITSSGNTDSTIASVTTNSPDFVIGEGSQTVPHGTSLDDWTIRPAAGLEAGIHTAAITVTYNNGATATGEASITVHKAPQDAPDRPVKERSSYHSISLEPLAPNEHGAAPQYRVNGGAWQSSPVFEELKAGTSYVLEQRYGAVGSYLASPASSARYSTHAYPVRYEIRIVPSAHGSVTTSAHNASAGTQITVTASAEKGYVLDYVTVDGTTLSGTTFTMPDHAVEVSAVFVRDGETMLFTDVPVDAWYFDAVSDVYANGLMDGVSAAKFNPDGAVTRAMVWTVLVRMAGENTDGGATWYSKAQAWAMETGVSDGTNPMGSITREQLAAMLYRFEGSPAVSGNLNAYPDASTVSDWAVDALIWATQEEIVNGMNGYLMPQTGATRAQLAAMLMRMLES